MDRKYILESYKTFTFGWTKDLYSNSVRRISLGENLKQLTWDYRGYCIKITRKIPAKHYYIKWFINRSLICIEELREYKLYRLING